MNKQKGASLLEVLIALLVVSIGLLGLAGLQTQSIKSNHSSYLRTQATLLAHDLSDRMRTSKDATENGAFDTDSTYSEKVAWENLLQTRLGSTASSTVEGIPNSNEFIITITWDDSRGDIGGPINENPESFSYRMEP